MTVAQARVNGYVCPSESLTGPVWASSWANYAANIGGPPAISGWSGPIVIMAKGPDGSAG